MDIGMLWFDNSQQEDLKSKIARAAAYYQKKYGQNPNMCFVHPSMLGINGKKEMEASEPSIKTGKVEVRPSVSILPNHFWIGVETVG